MAEETAAIAVETSATSAAEASDDAGTFTEAAPAYAQSRHPDEAIGTVPSAGHHVGGRGGFGTGVSN